MNIKVATTRKQRDEIESQLSRWESSLDYLYQKYLKDKKELEKRIEDYKNFWESNNKPIYSSSNKIFQKDRLHETKTIWQKSGKVSIGLLKEVGEWVCYKCLQPPLKKYIATGHDHTDYSYDVCDCSGVQNNKHYNDLN